MRLLKQIVKQEAGLALPVVLILLLFGGFFVIPCLDLMTTSLNVNRIVDERTKGLYAADAGVEDSAWQFANVIGGPFSGGDSYELDNNVNGMNVTVTKIKETEVSGGILYTVNATASLDGEIKGTVIAGIEAKDFDYSWLLDSAITSPGEVTLQPGVDVTGNVTCPEEPDGSGTYDNWNQEDVSDYWPETQDFRDFYFDASLPDFPGDEIDIGSLPGPDPRIINPLYRDGALTITNTDMNDPIAQLGGTVYVTGNVLFQVVGASKAYTIDLNGGTIYSEGEINMQPGFDLIGSGCIIAEGDIDFRPNTGSDPEDFIFIMSINGSSQINPNGDLYGAIAGEADVTLQPGCSLTWREVEEGELNFPDGSGGGSGLPSEVGFVSYTN